MHVGVARLARRASVMVGVSALLALSLTASLRWASAGTDSSHVSKDGFAGLRLENVASPVGLDFRQGAFRFGVSPDPAAMTGGGLCTLDYNNDGWLDLFVENSYSQADVDRWQKHGGLPRSALFRNRRGHFTNVRRRSRADLAVRGEGCVAADFNGDGYTDVYVTTASYDKLLWNNGDGKFTEGARAAGIHAYGWHAGAAVGDVNGDGRPDLYVAGYTDVNAPIPGSAAGFPNNDAGVRDLLYLNEGRDKHGRSRFREVGVQAGLESARFDHSLGAVFADFDGDGRLDLYVANDGDPNRLYQNVAWPGGAKADPAGLGFRFEERAGSAGVADPNAGMGVAAADYSGDGLTDLFVSNSRGQGHAVYLGRPPVASGSSFVDVRAGLAAAFGHTFTGWGASWVDLDLDTDLDLVLANGAIPVTNLVKNAEPVQVLENQTAQGMPGQFVDGNGLGDAASVSELVVRYPGGAETHLTDVTADRIVTVRPTPTVGPKPTVGPTPYLIDGCARSDLHGRSVARVWDEALLDAIRRDIPAPTTHARNLFHVSAAMWDAWAAYDPKADGYCVTEKHRAADALAARATTISFAAYRVLLWRYGYGANVRTTFDELTRTMRSLCYRIDFASTKGDSPAALGNRIAAAVIRYGKRDGALEARHYVDESYASVNAPLVVAQPGTAMHDPTFWQPLALDQTVAQNGLAVPGKVQTFIGAQWGHVRGFALPRSKKGLPIDPGPPPIGTPEDAAYKQAAVDVIRKSAELDPADGQTVAIGLDALGNNPLGTNDGHGYQVNPVTGKPYAPEHVVRGDYARVLAEFWADGPNSETPPGHWNVLANQVSDSPQLAARIGPGAANRLLWDVRLYFALNGAVHDAAIAAWGIKRADQSVRPISMIR